MWQYNATPTAVPPITGGALGPPTQTRRLEVGVVAGIHAPATARAAVERWLSGRVSEKFFDDKGLFEADDKTFSDAGAVGMWTKADSVTRFDDLRIEGFDRQ